MIKWLKRLLIRWLDIKPEYIFHQAMKRDHAYHEAVAGIRKNEHFINMLNEMQCSFTIECSRAVNLPQLYKYQSIKDAVNLIKFKIAESQEWLNNKQKEVENKEKIKEFDVGEGMYEYPPIHQDPSLNF